MGIITVVFTPSLESASKTIKISKKTRKVFKLLICIIRILFYLLDVGLDILAAYLFFTDDWQPKLGQWQLNYGKMTITYILMPVIATAIMYILGVVRDTKKSAMTKVRLVATALCFAPFITLYILLKSAVAVFNDDDPDNKADDDAARVRLLETVLETFPQTFLQILALQIKYNARYWDLSDVPSINNLEVFLCVKSIMILSFSVATSTYLFKANIGSRCIFFVCGCMSLISRILLVTSYTLIVNELMYFPGIERLGLTAYLPSMIVWFFKRVCGCYSTPLADIHKKLHMRNMFHVVVTWIITGVLNCFTMTGLLMSMITLVPAVYYAMSNDTLPVYFGPLNSTMFLAFAAATFVVNLLFVLIPRCRQIIGDQWLNKDEHGRSWLY